jgi:hypothetical protein
MPRVRRTTFAIVCLAVPLASCGQGVLKQHASERLVANFVFQNTGFRPTDVHCPSGIPAKVDATFACHFTGPEGPYTAKVRVTSVHGSRTTDYIVTHPDSGVTPRRIVNVRATEQTVTASVRERTGFQPTDVRCPFGVPARVGSRFDCRFTGPDGPYVAHVRITTVRGQQASDEIVTRRISR